MNISTDKNRILARRARELAQKLENQKSHGDVLQLLAFSLGKERFAIGIKFVQEVQPLNRLQWTLVPCTPAFVVGAVNIRSRIYAMMHVGKFLGIKDMPFSDCTHVILVRGSHPETDEKMTLALICDDIPKSVRVRSKSVQQPGGSVSEKSRAYVSGVSQNLLAILDLDKLLFDPAIIVDEHMK